MLLVRRINCAAESKRLRIKRTAGFVVIPLRLLLLKKNKEIIHFNKIIKKKLKKFYLDELA